MKPIQYISIQGRSAPSFWFKHHDAHNFRSLIESITLSETLFVSSIYRSDLFYKSEEDKSDLIIRIWCTCKGYPYDPHVKNRFTRATDLFDAFEFYFESLQHLKAHEKHYERYKARLNEIQLQEENNEILNALMKCDLHLAQIHQVQQLNYQKLTSSEMQHQKDLIHSGSFKTVADRYLQGAIDN